MNSRRTFLASLSALAMGATSVKAQNTLNLSGVDTAKTIEEIKKSFLFPAQWTEGEFEDRKLFFAVLVQPTDSTSFIDVHGWIYSEHFHEWRRFLQINTRHLGGAKLLLKEGIVSVRGTATNDFDGTEVLRFDLRATSNDAD